MIVDVCYIGAVNPSPSVGDPIQQTTLESEYASYERFCRDRDIRPAALSSWLEAKQRGWGTVREKLNRDSPAAVVRRQADDTATIRAVLRP
jgi:hypothetical protein